jgi:hypothetical protein
MRAFFSFHTSDGIRTEFFMLLESTFNRPTIEKERKGYYMKKEMKKKGSDTK